MPGAYDTWGGSWGAGAADTWGTSWTVTPTLTGVALVDAIDFEYTLTGTEEEPGTLVDVLDVP